MEFNSRKKKLVYLFGAGASAGILNQKRCLPILNDLPQELNRVAGEISPLLGGNSDHDEAYLKSIKRGLRWLGRKSIEYSTVDTYAKFLFINDDLENLNYLKRVLSFYFSYSQILNHKFDYRYLVLLISLMEEMRFPKERVTLLSWNYDYQVEIASSRLKEEKVNITSNSRGVYSHSSLLEYFPSFRTNDLSDNFDLYHLNGIAGVSEKNDNRYNPFLDNENKDQQALIKNLADNEYKAKYLIKFAWESPKPRLSRYPGMYDKLIDADILVVIGYSFPFYNREIDNRIFEALKEGALEKIIIQDPVKKGDFLKSQFGLDSNIKIEHRSDTNSFIVPYEF